MSPQDNALGKKYNKVKDKVLLLDNELRNFVGYTYNHKTARQGKYVARAQNAREQHGAVSTIDTSIYRVGARYCELAVFHTVVLRFLRVFHAGRRNLLNLDIVDVERMAGGNVGVAGMEPDEERGIGCCRESLLQTFPIIVGIDRCHGQQSLRHGRYHRMYAVFHFDCLNSNAAHIE